MNDVQPPYRADLQFVEFKCLGQQMRSLQRSTFSDNNLGAPTGWTTSVASEWNFVPPGSIASSLLKVACSVVNGIPSPATLIDYGKISEAVNELHHQMGAGGMAAATVYSTSCFARLTAKPNWSDLDYCVAFDAAAGALDAGVAKQLGFPRAEHFLPAAQLARGLSALKLVSRSAISDEERLNRINGQALIVLDENTGTGAPYPKPGL